MQRFGKSTNGKHHGRVECIVSERWLQFPQKVDASIQAGEVIWVSVMTRGKDDIPRKLCDLAVTLEDIQRALDLIGKE